MDKIYVFGLYAGTNSFGTIRDAEPEGDVKGYAVDGIFIDEADGIEKLNVITGHWSSGPTWCKHDMGITSDWKHDLYKKLHPDGYELEFLGFFEDPEEPFEAIKGKLLEK